MFINEFEMTCALSFVFSSVITNLTKQVKTTATGARISQGIPKQNVCYRVGECQELYFYIHMRSTKINNLYQITFPYHTVASIINFYRIILEMIQIRNKLGVI